MQIAKGARISGGERRQAARTLAIVSLALAALYCIALYYPLGQYSFYPRCPWKLVTQTHCPGCGVLRGATLMVHGDLLALARFNLLALAALPCLAFHFLSILCAAALGYRPPSLSLGRRGIHALLVVLVLYTLARNLIPTLAPGHYAGPS